MGAPATATAASTSATAFAGPLGSPSQQSFWLATPAGALWTFGSARYFGAPGAFSLAQPIVAMTPTADDGGYWSVASDGGLFSFGDAGFYGSMGGHPLTQPIVGLAPTPDAKGYWEVASDGGLFSFGDAGFDGSMGGHPLTQPIVGLAPTPDAKGYWEVARDGGIFAFGDAGFYGSMGGHPLTQPIVGIAPTPDAKGYWEVARDGGIFAFGDAGFYGSTGGAGTVDPAERVVADHDGKGYWIVDENGTAYSFGDAGPAAPPQALMFSADSPGDAAVLFAFYQLGKPYVWGGNGPVGYDCSGLALAAWQHGAGLSFARVSKDQYATAGAPVAMSDLAAGDLVFWATNTADPTTVDHTAIYVGGGRIVEATGDQVQLNSLDQWGTGGLMGNGRRP